MLPSLFRFGLLAMAWAETRKVVNAAPFIKLTVSVFALLLASGTEAVSMQCSGAVASEKLTTVFRLVEETS